MPTRQTGLTREEIIQEVTQQLAARQEIVFAYLFGSIAESEVFRDVDLGMYIGDMSTVGNGFDYAFKLSGELERLLGCRVDVILMNTAPDHLIHSISKGKLILNRDDDLRVDFVSSSWSRYFDIQPKRLQALRDMLS